jgi:hypothetical protein
LHPPLAPVYVRAVAPKRRHAWVGFAIFAVLAVVGLFVVHGVAAGVTLFVALLEFIFACIYALGGEQADSVAHSNRGGFAGWFGGWF